MSTDYIPEEDPTLDVVQLDGLVINSIHKPTSQVVLKIIKHCKENLPELVTGQLLGLDVGKTLEVTNCFPYPSKTAEEDEETPEASLGGAEYQIEMMRCLREVNVDNNTVGWYSSTYMGSFINEGTIGRKKKGQKKGAGNEEEKPKWSAEDFLQKAEELVETYQPELAQKFYERVI